MLRAGLACLLATIALVGGWTLIGGAAQGQLVFKTVWDKKYFTEGSEMKKAYMTSNCNFCHIGGTEDRKHLNDYGKALGKLLNAEDAKNYTISVKLKNPDLYKKTGEKILKAFEMVEKQHSDPNDKASPTFGELIRTGKLPKSPDKLPEK